MMCVTSLLKLRAQVAPCASALAIRNFRAPESSLLGMKKKVRPRNTCFSSGTSFCPFCFLGPLLFALECLVCLTFDAVDCRAAGFADEDEGGATGRVFSLSL